MMIWPRRMRFIERLSFFVTCLFFSFLMNTFNIATLNLNGARGSQKRAGLFELVKQRKIDVLLAQETHSDAFNAIEWEKEWNGLAILSHNTTLSGGVAILFSHSFIPHSYTVEEVLKGF